MVYKANKPQGTDKFKLSPSDINGNFTDLKTAFDVNHVALTGAGGNQGKHLKVDLTNQNPAPTPGVGTTDITLYNAVGATLTTVQQLWMAKNIPGPAVEAFPITEGAPTLGWLRHGSGILIKYGSDTSSTPGSGTYAFTFPVSAPTIPPFVTAPTVIVQLVDNAGANTISLQTGVTTTGFTVKTGASSPVTVNYIAVGT